MSLHTVAPLSPRAGRRLADHFRDFEKQNHGAQLGMWVFLASEVLFFGGLFVLYAAYRGSHVQQFREAAHHTDLVLATIGTFVLLAASLCVVLAVASIRADRHRPAWLLLAGSAGLAVAFLGLKFYEYAHHFRDGIYPGSAYAFEQLPGPGAQMFFTLYYLITGVHALHVIGGVLILGWLAFLTARGRYDRVYHSPVELGGMYWHFVDIVWLFVWPCFYLLR